MTTTLNRSDTDLSAIWQPLQIGPMQLKHRVIVPARILNWAPDSVLSERHFNHYEHLVDGGAAMIITEQHAAYPTAKGSFHNGCTAWEERAIPGFERMAEIVHARDARGVVQLYGTGVHDKGTMMFDEWKPLWGVSELPSIAHTETPVVMGKTEIGEIIAGYVKSAANVRAGGLDGVELHGAHGYLLGQFLSRVYNNRTDEYGGSAKNRARLIVQIGEEIRSRVGTDLAMGVRLSYDEFVGPAGITPDEADEHVSLLVGTGLFDYFSISAGNYYTLDRTVSPMEEKDGHLVPFARRAKEIVGERAAVFAVGRIRDLHLAEEVVKSGSADVVAIGRGQLADPDLVNKTREGREHEIIRCTGANECVARLWDGLEVMCMMNPVTGREGKWRDLPMVERVDSKRVLVVGGGPSGMKLAAVAASRGHSVTLVERGAVLGGHLNLLASMPDQDGFNVAIDDLVRAVDNADVEVRLDTNVDAAFVREFDADEVFVAEGARYADSGVSLWTPGVDSLPGADTPAVSAIDEAIKRSQREGFDWLGARVVIVDESSTTLPLAFAEQLAAAGIKVSVITPQLMVGNDVFKRGEFTWRLPALAGGGVEMIAQRVVHGFADGNLVTSDMWSRQEHILEGVTAVVLSIYRTGNTALFDELADAGIAAHRIGDGLAPRKLQAIIYESEKAARDL
ncbi:2,4-dienoyl-CoA reductase-like NADH-dependent reductase (Old Yellow Enzyme family) [Nocardioides ginsengisegetis]|uniref:2,4-dienoyl-CoA reductase-like NADH-dependent reductase (Old Yellow Enzyme family) n=1 Tax=Nocardioides ginsengisegetis TaxID=661491 RepID=A0A7W3IZC7_9ACTN|nr:FAD-dependent oxidoreductase [Nocardioides ginsengisegetis]MBA8803274.1 2,4-dienoyl-CoA reductase-like NADH-dependent reductase (Old Yellow Enzyme family) [Nocardioides ginsengisegetis]